MVGVVALPETFHLQVQEEALHHRVVPAVALAAYAGDQAVLVQQRRVSLAGVLLGLKESSQHPLVERQIVGRQALQRACSIPASYGAAH